MQAAYEKLKFKNVFIVPLASEEPREAAESYWKALEVKRGRKGFDIKIESISALYDKSKKDIDLPYHLEQLNKCDFVIFTGGDQVVLDEHLRGTQFLEIVQERYNKGELTVYGSSAGAHIAGENFLYDGDDEKLTKRGESQIGEGFGFIKNVLIDTHFFARCRFNRFVMQLLMENVNGIALNENSGIFYNGKTIKAIGEDVAYLFNVKDVTNNNIFESFDEYICAGNIKMSILAPKYEFDLTKWKII